MKEYLLLATSILLETGKNVFSNNFSKKTLQNETDIYKFNTFLYTGSFAVLCCTGGWEFSAFTVVTALLFAAALWLNQYFFPEGAGGRSNGLYQLYPGCFLGNSGDLRRCGLA